QRPAARGGGHVSYDIAAAVDGAEDAPDLVAPPGAPLKNAERFVRERYQSDGHRLLACQGGVFYLYDGTAWPELEIAALRAGVYEHFADARYPDGKMRPAAFSPSARKVSDLLDALAAVAHLPTTVTAPAWLGEGPVDARDVIPAANG